jgi:hypothetical protein
MEFLTIIGRGILAGLGGVALFELIDRYASHPPKFVSKIRSFGQGAS